jgi:signal transduction histidine kinase
MKTIQQVEKELGEFIERFLLGDKLFIEDVKRWVYEESGAPLEAIHKFQAKFFEYFDATGADINEVLQISTDAWNYFPHEILGGKSPHQIVKEYK